MSLAAEDRKMTYPCQCIQLGGKVTPSQPRPQKLVIFKVVAVSFLKNTICKPIHESN